MLLSPLGVPFIRLAGFEFPVPRVNALHAFSSHTGLWKGGGLAALLQNAKEVDFFAGDALEAIEK